MNRTRVVAVLAGYAAAIVAALLAGWADDLRVRALGVDSSGGMFAGGEMLASLGAFVLVALVPTALALWWLRGHRVLWSGVAAFAIAFAGAGLLALLAPRRVPRDPASELFELLALAQFVGAPLWAGAFTLFAWLAPRGAPRRAMFVAVALQLAACAFAAARWLAVRPPS
jgi:hypothetical protein